LSPRLFFAFDRSLLGTLRRLRLCSIPLGFRVHADQAITLTRPTALPFHFEVFVPRHRPFGAAVSNAKTEFAAIKRIAGDPIRPQGVKPFRPLGSMLNAAPRFLTSAPWMAIWPGLAIFLVVLSLNLVGDGLS
jgi:hypothetical protein